MRWQGRLSLPARQLAPTTGFLQGKDNKPCVAKSFWSLRPVFFLFISSEDVYSISLCCLLPSFLQSSCHTTLFLLVREKAEDTSFHFLLYSILLSCNFPNVTFNLLYLTGFWKVWNSRGCSACMAWDPPVALDITVGSALTLVRPELWQHLGSMACWKIGEEPAKKRVV